MGPYRKPAPPDPPDAPPPGAEEWMLPAVPLVLSLMRIVLWAIAPGPPSAEPGVAIAVAVICTLLLLNQARTAWRRRRTRKGKDFDVR